MVRARHIPERKCVACGQRFPKCQLTRIVRTPQGAVHADATGKTSGRGAYLCIASECWEKGLRKGGLERSLQVKLTSHDREKLFDHFRECVAPLTSVEE